MLITELHGLFSIDWVCPINNHHLGPYISKLVIDIVFLEKEHVIGRVLCLSLREIFVPQGNIDETDMINTRMFNIG
jgi:hypothetical protein